jgi:CHAT domain-containing protein
VQGHKKVSDRAALARALIGAARAGERKKLLSDFSQFADLALARAIKDICYESWTTDPAIARRAATALESVLAFVPNREIEGITAWIRGIAEITSGRLESAAESLKSASVILSKLGLRHESAQPQVARLIPLAMLGKYDEAVASGKKALRIFSTFGDHLAAGKVELNLSNIAARRELYREAEQYGKCALARFKALNEGVWLAMSENSLANTYAEMNELGKAARYYGAALESSRAAGMTVTEAEIEASLGNLARYRGNYAEALEYFELSRQKYDRLDMPHQSAIASVEIADCYAELNLEAEARDIYRKVTPVLRKLRLNAEEARVRLNHGRIARSVGEIRTAHRQLGSALRLFRLEENPDGSAMTLLELSRVRQLQGNAARAIELAREAAEILKASASPRRKIEADSLVAELTLQSGDAFHARALFEDVLARSVRSEMPVMRQSVLNSIGRIELHLGRVDRAASYFRRSIRLLETLRDPLPGEEFRMSFAAGKLDPYLLLAKLLIGKRRIEDAFLLTERARARTLLETMSSNVGGKTDDVSVDAVRARLNWIYRRLETDLGTSRKHLFADARRVERELAELLRRKESSGAARSRSPRHGPQSGAAKGLDLGELRSRLGKKKILIEYVIFEDKLSAFTVTASGVRYFEDLAEKSEVIEVLEALRFQFGSMRYDRADLGPLAANLRQRTNAILHWFYEKLIAPMGKEIGSRDVVIIPAGPLNYLPFNAMHDGTRYLIEDRTVVIAPSAGVWLQLVKRRRRACLEPAVLFGFADDRIPLVNDEIASLRELLPDHTAFTGPNATFAAFVENAPSARLLHLACHGEFRPDNPMYSSLRLYDGKVTVRDICSHRLSAELVTLSACETGLSKVISGEEILGLARGFLSAGARNIVLSLWTVNDTATAKLMVEFYLALQRGKGIAASLRIAQLSFIENEEHPYFWAPFALIGN